MKKQAALLLTLALSSSSYARMGIDLPGATLKPGEQHVMHLKTSELGVGHKYFMTCDIITSEKQGVLDLQMRSYAGFFDGLGYWINDTRVEYPTTSVKLNLGKAKLKFGVVVGNFYQQNKEETETVTNLSKTDAIIKLENCRAEIVL